ncbi:MAG: glucosaminidase domain-containing protein [Acidobacteriaceae bacterium]|nr:glucosaminidase domain-containing protein [Acidobacteriaceae bacterium]
MIVVGLLALPLTIRTENRPSGVEIPTTKQPGPFQSDPRTVRLKRFFSKLHCPVSDLAEDFVQAADDNRLDWRLLPSISVIESGGGKAYRNNNILGWNQGLEPFPTIRAGIHAVAFKLAKSPLYQNRDVLGKLRLYNPNESYAGSVLAVMNRISPAAAL